MTTDLKKKSRKELEKLLKDVKAALQNAQARDRRAARKAAEKAAAEFGFSLNDLSDQKVEKATKKPRKKAAGPKAKAKYANPADASQTWTGKGRQPNWFKSLMQAGTDPQTLEI